MLANTELLRFSKILSWSMDVAFSFFDHTFTTFSVHSLTVWLFFTSASRYRRDMLLFSLLCCSSPSHYTFHTNSKNSVIDIVSFFAWFTFEYCTVYKVAFLLLVGRVFVGPKLQLPSFTRILYSASCLQAKGLHLVSAFYIYSSILWVFAIWLSA